MLNVSQAQRIHNEVSGLENTQQVLILDAVLSDIAEVGHQK